MTEMIDARLTNRISGLINDFISENGVDSVKVHNGLDIEKVRLFTGKSGGSAVRFFDIISSDRKIIKPLRITSKLSQESNIFVYNDIFVSSYNNLVDLAENKYNPNPIYVKTF